MWDIHKGYQGSEGEGRASKILYVHSISATWNRVDRTRGPRLSQTIPCAVRVVPSYARTAVVRSKCWRVKRKLPSCTQCANIPFFCQCLSRPSWFGSGLQRPLHTGVEYGDSECKVKIILSEGNWLGIKYTSHHSLQTPRWNGIRDACLC